MAHIFFNIAGANDFAVGKEYRTHIARDITVSQIEQVADLVRQ